MQQSAQDNTELIGVILAAGKGMRAYPATRYIPKVLLNIAGKTLLERNLEILTQQLGIRDIIIVIGHYGDQIIDHIGDSYDGASIRYVEQREQNGIGHALLTVEPYIGVSRFIVILGDELYIDSNHRQLLEKMDTDPAIDAVLMFKHEEDPNKISHNYTAILNQDRVLNLVEKPKNPVSDLMGLGSSLLTAKIFDYIRATPPSSLRNEVEITDALSKMAQKEDVRVLMNDGLYLNVNTADDRNLANYLIRDRKFDRCKVTVVIPAYNEEETIAVVIREYLALDCVSDVLVVNNNSADNTAAVAAAAGAEVITETSQGYGCALQRGLNDASGDIIIITEADGSFSPIDAPKLLEYLKDCDMAIGTRTTRQMIEQGANMGFLARLINVIFGKMIEILWWNQEPRFTDVGCSYRAIWKSSWEKIRPYVNAGGPAFSPDMMMGLLICKMRVIEIPVTYRRRRGGDSKHSSGFTQLANTALKMLKLIIKRRFMYSPLNRNINALEQELTRKANNG